MEVLHGNQLVYLLDGAALHGLFATRWALIKFKIIAGIIINTCDKILYFMKKIKLSVGYIMPIISIFLIACSVGDKLWSFEYLIKTIPALFLLAISFVLVIIDYKFKNNR